MLGVAALAGVTALGSVELSPLTALVPISGLALGIRDSIAGQLSANQLAPRVWGHHHSRRSGSVCRTTLIAPRKYSLSSGTSHRRKKGQLGIEATVTYGIALVLFWFLGRMAMEQHLIGGMLFNQLAIIAATAIAVLLWLGIPIRPTIQLNRPHWVDLGWHWSSAYRHPVSVGAYWSCNPTGFQSTK